MASTEEVRHLASLARLSLPEETLPALAAEFDSILAYIGQLDELSLDRSATPAIPAVHNAFREDVHPNVPGAYTDAITAQFPERDGDLLSVPQVIAHD
jgi:aspartyl-tRNA(Asn)/glutamyl-tRNA(Gln) amidotransferase subunit C